MVGHTGVIPAAVTAIETVDACLGADRRGRPGDRRRAASSPPTTATPTTCSSPTARRTPRTRSTRCRSSSPSRARALDPRAASSPTSRRPRWTLLGIAQPPEMTGRSLLVRLARRPRAGRRDRRAGGARACSSARACSRRPASASRWSSAPILFALLGPREAVTAGVLARGAHSTGSAGDRAPPAPVLVRDAVALVAWSLPGLVLGVLALRAGPERPLSASSRSRCSPGSGCACAITARGAGAAAPRGVARARRRGFERRRAVDLDLAERPAARLLPARARRAARAAMRDTLAAIFIAEAVLGLPALPADRYVRHAARRRGAAARRPRRAAARPAGVRLAAGRALRAGGARGARAHRPGRAGDSVL